MKSNFSLFSLFFLAIIAFANLTVFTTPGTIISTAILVIVAIVAFIYIQDAENSKNKALNDMIVRADDVKLYNSYLDVLTIGILILDRNRNVVYSNNEVPEVVLKDLKSDTPSFDHFLTKISSFLESEKEKEQYDFVLGNRTYCLKMSSFTPVDEELIAVVFADKKEKSGRDIKKVYGKFWNFLKIGPISVLDNYLVGLRDNVGEISQDIFLSDNTRKQVDNIMGILDRSKDDIDNLSLMVNVLDNDVVETDFVPFIKKTCSDLSADKDYVKIKVIDNLNEKPNVSINRNYTKKIIKNISDNVSEYTKSKKLDVELNYTYETVKNSRVVEVRFISHDANIAPSIFKGLGKGIKTSKKGKHLGLGLEIVKKLTIAQGANIDFRHASNGFTIVVTFAV